MSTISKTSELSQAVASSVTARAGARAEARPRLNIVDVVEREGAFVLRLVRRLGVHDADVDDVAQEVFVTLHRRHDDWDEATPLRSWIFGVVRRTVANYLRRAQVHRTRSAEMARLEKATPQTVAEGEEGLQRRRDRAILESALCALDAEKREVFVLFELEGLDMKEVAQLVGCPLKTAYSRLYAARAMVRKVVLRAKEGTR